MQRLRENGETLLFGENSFLGPEVLKLFSAENEMYHTHKC